MRTNILNQDKVASTIKIINQHLRMALHQANAKNPKFLYYTFKGNTVEQIIKYIRFKGAKSALVIDDLGLQIINRLIQEGVKDITLCLARFPVEHFAIVKYIILNSFPQLKINIIHYEELQQDMKVDLIISNPAYGAIGANITYEVKDIEYKEFITLLPANDYKRNKDKNLFNYQSDMIAINDGFEDAVVTTHLARISKTPVNTMTVDEFTITQCIDPQLDKYFSQQASRSLTLDYKDPSGKRPDLWHLDRTLLIGWRDGANRHLPYSKEVETYKWNVEESLDKETFIADKNRTRAANSGTYELCYFTYTFKTSTEKRNIAKFLYSEEGFKFISKVFTAENSDGNKEIFIELALPKVDWTRPWTVEEILREYGYAEEEIAEVMSDLVNYKGMEN